jgi:hypothetical protein
MANVFTIPSQQEGGNATPTPTSKTTAASPNPVKENANVFTIPTPAGTTPPSADGENHTSVGRSSLRAVGGLGNLISMLGGVIEAPGNFITDKTGLKNPATYLAEKIYGQDFKDMMAKQDAARRGTPSITDLVTGGSPQKTLPPTDYADIAEKAFYGDVRPAEQRTFPDKVIERGLLNIIPGAMALKAGLPVLAGVSLAAPVVGQATETVTDSPAAGILAELLTGVGAPTAARKLGELGTNPLNLIQNEAKATGMDLQEVLNRARQNAPDYVTAPEALAAEGLNAPLQVQRAVAQGGGRGQDIVLQNYLQNLNNQLGDALGNVFPGAAKNTNEATKGFVGASEKAVKNSQKTLSDFGDPYYRVMADMPLINQDDVAQEALNYYGTDAANSTLNQVRDFLKDIKSNPSVGGFFKELRDTPPGVTTSASTASRRLDKGFQVHMKNWLYNNLDTGLGEGYNSGVRDYARKVEGAYGGAKDLIVNKKRNLLTKTGIPNDTLANADAGTLSAQLKKYLTGDKSLNTDEVNQALGYVDQADPNAVPNLLGNFFDKGVQQAKDIPIGGRSQFDPQAFQKSQYTNASERESYMGAMSRGQETLYDAGADTRAIAPLFDGITPPIKPQGGGGSTGTAVASQGGTTSQGGILSWDANGTPYRDNTLNTPQPSAPIDTTASAVNPAKQAQIKRLMESVDIAARRGTVNPRSRADTLNQGTLGDLNSAINPNMSSSAVKGIRNSKRSKQMNEKVITAPVNQGLDYLQKMLIDKPQARDRIIRLLGITPSSDPQNTK